MIINIKLLSCLLFLPLYVFQPTVDIKTVLSRLMERLSNYAASSAEVSNLCYLPGLIYKFYNG